MNKLQSILVTFALYLSMSCYVAACEIKFRVQPYPPFSIQNADGSWGGLDMDYAKMLLNKIECQIKPVRVPWGRGLEMLRVGSLDLMVNVTKTPEREKNYYFVGPQRVEKIRLIGLKDGIEPIDSWAKLANTEARYMRQIGAFYGDRFEQLIADSERFKGELIELPDNRIRLRLLQKHRVMGVFSEELYADHSAANLAQPDLLFKHPLIIQQTPVYFAFSKFSVSEQQINKIRAAFSAISQTKQYKAVGQGQ